MVDAVNVYTMSLLSVYSCDMLSEVVVLVGIGYPSAR